MRSETGVLNLDVAYTKQPETPEYLSVIFTVNTEAWCACRIVLGESSCVGILTTEERLDMGQGSVWGWCIALGRRQGVTSHTHTHTHLCREYRVYINYIKQYIPFICDFKKVLYFIGL